MAIKNVTTTFMVYYPSNSIGMSKKIWAALATPALFTILFYKQSIGLNLLLFELLTLSLLQYLTRTSFQTIIAKSIVVGTLITMIFVVVHASTFVIAVNISSFFLCIGVYCFPMVRSPLTSFVIALFNITNSWRSFFENLGKSNLKLFQTSFLWKGLKIFGIPVVIGFCFIQIYRFSSPYFEEHYFTVMEKFNAVWLRITALINWDVLPVFLLGLVLSVYIFMHSTMNEYKELESGESDDLVRKRKKTLLDFQLLDLKFELKSAIYLLAFLNLLLLFVNVLDVYWVWFNFEWNGDYLKQFVHEGTYLLLLSIVISIALVLYYFRGNLNFYRKNKMLLTLSRVWLAQNAILAISVAIRNAWYINYFALAYKRIAVLFFLILILVGLWLVVQKITKTKSNFYLFRWNAFALYLTFVVVSLVNWDRVISRYNFSHSKSAFIHYNFLATLSDNSLPLLYKTKDELAAIDEYQQQSFQFNEEYMTSEMFHEIIDWRIETFVDSFPKRDILSWNFADQKAFERCKEICMDEGKEE